MGPKRPRRRGCACRRSSLVAWASAARRRCAPKGARWRTLLDRGCAGPCCGASFGARAWRGSLPALVGIRPAGPRESAVHRAGGGTTAAQGAPAAAEPLPEAAASLLRAAARTTSRLLFETAAEAGRIWERRRSCPSGIRWISRGLRTGAAGRRMLRRGRSAARALLAGGRGARHARPPTSYDSLSESAALPVAVRGGLVRRQHAAVRRRALVLWIDRRPAATRSLGRGAPVRAPAGHLLRSLTTLPKAHAIRKQQVALAAGQPRPYPATR